ncbi:MAG: response regulator [Rhodospirillaceae bacterium]|mgnify:FL=1|jgi:CheY-like chemotaxis protein|nr:response regulator [Rhodospirillaceae bacterium]MBT3627092.1 response regulator [Rhodospirillaceae bacterium]MBT3925433.1 response regulator [Rhodospirillaceae bacterium]MBT4428051.1 response regulator [Rhodospirillaceae bacterium]MBT5037338.1 response regulator [Rhodospirillaceae bacterium]
MTANNNNGAHLLLVEDEAVAAKMLSQVFNLEGYRVSNAPDGVAALELMADETPDALITDLKMPRGGGGELVREARARHANLPIVVVTGYFTGDVERELKELGVSAILLKPVALRDLIDAVKSALSPAGD